MDGLGTLMTLKEACARYFRGAITPATLRAEASRGKLRITRIGRRDFVSEMDLQEMVELCRRPRQQTPPPPSQSSIAGSLSETERAKQASAALAQIVRELKSQKRKP